jgi:hypothetical protein
VSVAGVTPAATPTPTPSSGLPQRLIPDSRQYAKNKKTPADNVYGRSSSGGRLHQSNPICSS